MMYIKKTAVNPKNKAKMDVEEEAPKTRKTRSKKSGTCNQRVGKFASEE
tara:strand:+ start:163 stop:309 length:147 start_codon:yes stop_codon:yes gene_type:complete